ncbi:MAG TPA: M28 family peptidase [Thermoleophilaceae bacterium]|nr:M28 family peptidase [Thermoleophilaceae bacterium]
MRRALIERVVSALASFERPSASDGERKAAEWLAGELRSAGCDVRIEEERAHGGYWWPLGLLNAASAVVALARRRLLSVLVGGTAAAAIWDDVSGGRLWFRRATLPHRATWNVVAESGDRSAERTLVLIAHHDAAHTGLVFHPELPRIGMRLAPEQHERANQSLPILFGVFLGPLFVALGALLGRGALRRAGITFSLGATAAMADIGSRGVVPGANDNLSAVAALVAVAHSLRERPVEGVRVILLSTGSEESFMEGMQGFGRRHFADLPRGTTEFLCLECVGSPELCVVEGEGMLRMRHYPADARDALARAGERAGVKLRRGLRTVAASDALIALRAGYRVSLLGGVDETKFPANYHWHTDTPENLSWESVEAAAATAEAWVRAGAPA